MKYFYILSILRDTFFFGTNQRPWSYERGTTVLHFLSFEFAKFKQLH